MKSKLKLLALIVHCAIAASSNTTQSDECSQDPETMKESVKVACHIKTKGDSFLLAMEQAIYPSWPFNFQLIRTGAFLLYAFCKCLYRC
jgi:hypothetical protein